MNAINAPTLLWFRQDLRLQDNLALAAAVSRGAPILPVYILDDDGDGRWLMGAVSREWLHHSLAALAESLRALGSRLIFARGASREILLKLVGRSGASAIYWNRRYEPVAASQDTTIARDFSLAGLEVKTFNAALLHEPHVITNKRGRPFRVFTPYWRHCLTLRVEQPVKFLSKRLSVPAKWPVSLKLTELDLLPQVRRDGAIARPWKPGEAGATRRLMEFTTHLIDDYAEQRNRPDRDGTSRLSASLHFGEISPRQLWAAVKLKSKTSGVFPPSNGARVFLSEIGWREFAYHTLYHFPTLPESPLREEFNRFVWAKDRSHAKLRAWRQGLTGYPIVDAGMRQLRATGWMHNRARMICASFLVKHLQISWKKGAAWFWDTLIDADLANNALGWQWVAGCGVDASPYFRVFAPVLQGRKFDPDGDYVRRWIPELARLSREHIHAPWEISAAVLADVGICLGHTYPFPIVDHVTARNEALAAFKKLRSHPVAELHSAART